MTAESTIAPLGPALRRSFAHPAQLAPTDHGDRRSISDVEYALVPGYRPLLLDLTIPLDRPAPAPVVVYVHGGAWMIGSHKPHPGPVRTQAIFDSLLERGIAVASVQYRLSSEALFPACLHDVSAAVRWLRRFAPELGIAGDRIGTWGESAGAHLSTFLAMNIPDDSLTGDLGVTGVAATVQGAVGWYAPTALHLMQEQAISGSLDNHDDPDSPESLLLGAPVQSVRDLARNASPATWANGGAAPLLLIHGECDRVVPPEQSETLARALRNEGADVDLILVPGADHVFIGADPAPLIERSADFLLQRLCSGGYTNGRCQ